MVAPFKDNRRILAGFALTPSAADGRRMYAGHLVFRELIQHKDGTLGTKWPEEMIPPSGQPVAWSIDSHDPGIERTPTGVRLCNDGFLDVALTDLPSSYQLSAIVRPGQGVKAFGLSVGAHDGHRAGCELRFEPAAQHVQWGSSEPGEPAEYVPEVLECRCPHARDRGADFALDKVEGLGSIFTLDLIVKHDPQRRITLIDACIDRRRTMITQRCHLQSDLLFLFVQQGEVALERLVVRPLAEQA
jgi:hypothetical protein